MELALTGETITAERGAELGLINRVAEPGKSLEAALQLAEEVAANAPLATAASKSILNQQGSWDDATFWARQGEIVAPVFTSEDAIEGATAFARSGPELARALDRSIFYPAATQPPSTWITWPVM